MHSHFKNTKQNTSNDTPQSYFAPYLKQEQTYYSKVILGYYRSVDFAFLFQLACIYFKLFLHAFGIIYVFLHALFMLF